MAVCQNLVPLVNIKIAGKWMFIPLKIVLIGIDPYPYIHLSKPIKTDAWIGLFRYLCQGGKVGTYVAVRWLPYVSPALR